jgi:TPR repeat protein
MMLQFRLFPASLSLFIAFGAGICQATPNTLQDGAGAYQRGDYTSARRTFQALAERGDATAQFNLAVMSAQGLGAPRNLPDAAKWYRAAAEQGDPESALNLAVLLENGSGLPTDYVKAYILFDSASRALTGKAVQSARAHRDQLTAKMATGQLIMAQDLARQCQTETVSTCSARILALPSSPGGQGLFPAPVSADIKSALRH